MCFSDHALASDRPIPHSKIPNQYSYFVTYKKILQLNTKKQISVLTCTALFSLRKAARIALSFSCKWRAFWSWEFVLPAEPSLNNVNTVHTLNGEIATFMYFPASTEVVCKMLKEVKTVHVISIYQKFMCHIWSLLNYCTFIKANNSKMKNQLQ
jgi:hypothetical protein